MTSKFLTCLGFWTLFCVVEAEGAFAETRPDDPEREVIVRFADGAFHWPRGNDPGPISTAQMPADLRATLESFGVDRIRRALPRSSVHRPGSRADPIGIHAAAASKVMLLRTPDPERRRGLIAALEKRADVIYAEPNGRIVSLGTPNDVSFHRQWGLQNIGQYGGSVGGDVRAWAAWDLHQGNPNEPIGIIGEPGNVAPHVEFGARLYGSIGSDLHATRVAGIAAASGGNGQGIAGVNWQCGIYSDNGGGTVADNADQMKDAVNTGVRVLNNSWAQEPGVGWITPLAEAIVYAHNAGAVTVFGMPENAYPNEFPSNYFDGKHSINVGACGNQNVATIYQIANPWVDLAAPGGTTEQLERGLYTTEGTSSYGYTAGTSFAVPHVSGAASLLRSYASQQLGLTLAPEDVEEILKRSADDIDVGLFDNKTGFGRINVRRALEYVRDPNLVHGSAVGGTVTSNWSSYQQMEFNSDPVLSGYSWVYAKQYTVDRTVTVSYQGVGTVSAFWTRPSASLGFNGASPTNYADHYCSLLSGNANPTATLRTFVYHVLDSQGVPLGWFPTTAGSAVFAWTTLRYTRYNPQTSGFPSAATSYFVPQVGSTGSPTEGDLATTWFRTCPNNDPGSLVNNARVKVVLRNSSNGPIAGVSAADIYVVLRGGTAAQGFPAGPGADSVIANSLWNQTPTCPDLRVITADASTDASGVTYITFKGATEGSPGVASRDPTRKWGHYDSSLPVYALGVPLQGRLTTGSANGSYTLRIRNYDVVGGLNATLNEGESVDGADVAEVLDHLGHTVGTDALDRWFDFDNNGTVNGSDVTTVNTHQFHNCSAPSSP